MHLAPAPHGLLRHSLRSTHWRGNNISRIYLSANWVDLKGGFCLGNDDQRNGNHASVDEILQGTIVSVWSRQGTKNSLTWKSVPSLCTVLYWATHPCVRVSSVALLTGAGVVPRRVVTKGVCSTSVGLSTLVNVWRRIIIYNVILWYDMMWWYMTVETKARVEGQDCGGLSQQARKQLIFLLLTGWWLGWPHYQMIYCGSVTAKFLQHQFYVLLSSVQQYTTLLCSGG